jgi:transcriptional regulator of acetoin/glycerol metabolism
MEYFNTLFSRQVERLADAAWEYFLAYDWPGNIRELRNLLEAVFIHTSSSEIQAAELPRHLREDCDQTPRLPEDERKRLLSALMETDWNKSKAADKLRWSRMTLYRKMAKYQVTRSCASGL